MIKYLGSKRTLIPVILDAVRRVGDGGAEGVGGVEGAGSGGRHPVRSVIDLFSGTSRVGHALKRAGYRVLANDHNAYAHVLARCYVQADRDDVLDDAQRLVHEFNAMKGAPGYFTRTFCERSRYIQPRNGERIDAIREAIAAKSLPPDLEAVMLVALMEAADRVDSTTGLQMAYLKSWSPRSHNDLELRVPDVLSRAAHGKGEAHQLEALDAVASLEADVAYIDPPYNQHSYLGNYHVWESLVRWDKPEVYGVACKRLDVRDRGSAFNSRRQFHEHFRRVLGAVRARTLIISFSNEGYISRADMESLLAETAVGNAGSSALGTSPADPAAPDTRAHVSILETDYKRYVGAQIGIYNPQGEKVGKVSHLRNKEYLYVVTRDSAGRTQTPVPSSHSVHASSSA